MGQQKKCYYDQTEAIFKTITAQLLLDSVYSIIFTSYYDLEYLTKPALESNVQYLLYRLLLLEHWAKMTTKRNTESYMTWTTESISLIKMKQSSQRTRLSYPASSVFPRTHKVSPGKDNSVCSSRTECLPCSQYTQCTLSYSLWAVNRRLQYYTSQQCTLAQL